MKRYTAYTIFALQLLALLLNAPAQAYTYTDSYVPPEALHDEVLSQHVKLPRKVNVNHAALSELVALPGIDENIALKMMRIRPVENVQDFYRLPFMRKQDIDRLIQGLQQRVDF